MWRASPILVGDHRFLQAAALEAAWFARHPVEVAHALVGALVAVEREGRRVVARIVETEAYGGAEDDASHATMYAAGRTALAAPPGLLYMQRSYGLHTMTNIVAHTPGHMGAVLLRAAEDPLVGEEHARERRAGRDRLLLVGPGNLSQGIGTRLSDTLKPVGPATGVLLIPGSAPRGVRAGPRIGISRATDVPWRFFDAASPAVSRHRRGNLVTADDLASLVDAMPPRTHS